MAENLSKLATEQTNSKSENIDTLSTLEIAKIINEEDEKVALAVKAELETISKAVDLIVDAFNAGGRLIYLGSGTSGRIAFVDLIDCPPTFGISDEMITGIISGGDKSLTSANEGTEDDVDLAVSELKRIGLTKSDIVCGIGASGRTPFVIAGLDYAKSIGAKTIALSCAKGAKASSHADVGIEVDTGAEVISGSTRMKAGTAQKMVLNMLSTMSMIKTGYVYKNLMVGVKQTNEKTKGRCLSIIESASGCDRATSEHIFEQSGKDTKVAIVMAVLQCDASEARTRLAKANGFVRQALK